MKNKLYLIVFLVLIGLTVIVVNLNSANAFCAITGYTRNASIELTNSTDYIGYCQDDGSIQHIYNSTGGAFSWGGPFDTCDAFCGNVYINATNDFMGITGNNDIGYPLNSGNVPGWGNSTTKRVGNVTMYGAADVGCVDTNGTIYHCGEAILGTCSFNADLDCSGETYGLTVSGNDIDVNCRGYNITGDTTGTAFLVLGTNAIIKNCIIDSFEYGIFTPSENTTSIDNVITTITGVGIEVTGASDLSSIRDNINCKDNLVSDGILVTPGGGSDDNAKVIGGTIDNCSVGIAIIGGLNAYIYDTDFGPNIPNQAINFLSSTYNVSTNTFSSSFRGIYSDRGTGLIEKNIFTSDSVITGYGIFLEDGTDNVVWDNSLRGFYDAIKLDGETTAQVSKNVIIQEISPVPYGVTLTDSGAVLFNNRITSTSIIPASIGVYCDTSTATNYSGNNISTQNIGISAGACLFMGDHNRITGTNSVYDIGAMSLLEIDRLTTDQTTIDVITTDTELIDSSLGGITLPLNMSGIGIAYEIIGNSPFAAADINLTYGSTWPTIENSLSLWEYNGTWFNVTGSRLDTGNKLIYSGALTSFSIYAPLGNRQSGANIDDTTCMLLKLVLIFMAIAIMALSVWFGFASYKKYDEGSFNMNEMLGKLFAAMIGIFVGIALLVSVADIIAGMCLI